MTDELYHYGIKGMKWGIRRTPAQLGHKTKIANSEEKRQRKLDLKYRRQLSDKDLDQKIERLKKEKQFKELSEEDIAPGRTAVKKFLKSNGGKVLSNAAVGALAYLGYVAITGNVDPRQAAGYIFPNPRKR